MMKKFYNKKDLGEYLNARKYDCYAGRVLAGR